MQKACAWEWSLSLTIPNIGLCWSWKYQEPLEQSSMMHLRMAAFLTLWVDAAQCSMPTQFETPPSTRILSRIKWSNTKQTGLSAASQDRVVSLMPALRSVSRGRHSEVTARSGMTQYLSSCLWWGIWCPKIHDDNHKIYCQSLCIQHHKGTTVDFYQGP